MKNNSIAYNQNFAAGKYILKSDKKMRSVLQDIHNSILQVFQNGEYEKYYKYIVCEIPPAFPFPHYYFNNSAIIAFQKSIIGRFVRIYPQRGPIQREQAFANTFADRLSEYKANKRWEFVLPVCKAIDYELIKDIVRFEMRVIEENGGMKKTEIHLSTEASFEGASVVEK